MYALQMIALGVSYLVEVPFLVSHIKHLKASAVFL
jgi:hypothetical protein